MNQIATGMFIARKRKELNLTQAQLAERLGISSKSVSKWERGKCMPDYGIVNELCDTLGITVIELLDGEENERENLRVYDNDQMIEMLARIQRLESQRVTIIAIALIVMGIGLLALSPLLGGSDVADFLHGALFGIGVGTILIGVFLATRSIFEYLSQND
ncbi:helix-turn-helix domain-containing protein [Eggerthella guodeyinii]|uniref:Helix-turn-helix domain-containing protein n=1 Tax=Eggerthella guodeyinii TaxID=2690837 RepID=A0A6N7RPJ2_9ACTN|nr:helix-turn-helix transcriptional regulator [Eggerthella guodeyinii]MRX82907.1 helix-turn-helix domain-containing protein [Eggerthella guodeyinii]